MEPDENRSPGVSETSLREWLAALWVLAHILTVANLLIASLVIGGMSLKEMTTIGGIVVPLMAANTTLVVRHFVKHRHRAKDKGKTLNMPFVVIAIAFPAALFVYLTVAIYMFAFQRINNIETLKALVAFGEISFGVYAGMVFADLLTKEPK